MLWMFFRIVYEDFVIDLLWNNSVLIVVKVIVMIVKFLWLIGGEKKCGKLENMVMIEIVC